MRNVRTIDRFARAVIGILLLQAGFFWLGSPWSWVCLAAGAILLLTAVTGICPLYQLFGISPIAAKRSGKRPLAAGLAIILLAAIALGGSYASIFLTRKLFLEDFNAMNAHYKQALFLTGKGDRSAALASFDQLTPAFEAFSERYTRYRPYGLKGDRQLANDFNLVRQILSGADPLVRTGDLHEAHLTLEKVRPVFQDMFKRNGFSMLAIALVDFHDAMETILAPAAASNTESVISLYPAVSEKLKIVEAEQNDTEIQDIRKALDELLATAQSANADLLPEKGNTLKTNFVKVYLKRG